MKTTCNHGHRLEECAMCEKRAGECDYGSCTRPAVEVIRGAHEARATCPRHRDHVARFTA